MPSQEPESSETIVLPDVAVVSARVGAADEVLSPREDALPVTILRAAPPSDGNSSSGRTQPDDFSVDTDREDLWVTLQQTLPKEGREPGPRLPWHDVRLPPARHVIITSHSDTSRRIRLTVRGRHHQWQARWTGWSWASRAVSEWEGGALAAQDGLSEDGLALTLLLRPREQRAAKLEGRALLDDETWPGNYPFEIVATDLESGAESTKIGRLALRHPPASWLEYLPALFRERDADPLDAFAPYEERPFLERFLRGFEDADAPLRATVDSLFRCFDPAQAPADFLPWLGTWVSLVLDENWPELRRRSLIFEAVELYRWRGTRRGLARWLELYTGVKPMIYDQPVQGMKLGSQMQLGRRNPAGEFDASTRLGNVPPHTFVVTLVVADPGAVNEQIARDIIEANKPAHTAYDLRILTRADSPPNDEAGEQEIIKEPQP